MAAVGTSEWGTRDIKIPSRPMPPILRSREAHPTRGSSSSWLSCSVSRFFYLSVILLPRDRFVSLLLSAGVISESSRESGCHCNWSSCWRESFMLQELRSGYLTVSWTEHVSHIDITHRAGLSSSREPYSSMSSSGDGMEQPKTKPILPPTAGHDMRVADILRRREESGYVDGQRLLVSRGIYRSFTVPIL